MLFRVLSHIRHHININSNRLLTMQGAKRDLVLLKFNQIMEYDWGCSSHDSLIGQFSKGEHKRYAELWMGTHPKGMSKVGENMTLSQYLEQFKIDNLPFLFKVLCI